MDQTTGVEDSKDKKIKFHWEYFGIIVLILLYFIMPRYTAEGRSMEPTLQDGDRFFSWLVGDNHTYQYGDIVTFRLPQGMVVQGDLNFTKRVVGLPGDSVEIKDHQVFVNSQIVVEPYAQWDAYSLPDDQVILLSQNIEDKIQSSCVLDNCDAGTVNSWIVPEGAVFVLGDNRYGSLDSRIFGSIPSAQISSRAFCVYWPLKNAKSLR